MNLSLKGSDAAKVEKPKQSDRKSKLESKAAKETPKKEKSSASTGPEKSKEDRKSSGSSNRKRKSVDPDPDENRKSKKLALDERSKKAEDKTSQDKDSKRSRAGNLCSYLIEPGTCCYKAADAPPYFVVRPLLLVSSLSSVQRSIED